MHNLDIKVPGEHTLEGEQFDAEIQMLHTHLYDARISSIGIPVRATADGYNEEFQRILDQFQLVYNSDAMQCTGTMPNASQPNYTSTHVEGDSSQSATWDPEHPDDDPNLAQQPQTNLKFNPYSEAFMRTIFFYRYDGSITEPPCLPITWWVMSEPMLISHRQLAQIRHLLFTHVGGDECKGTSVHNADQSVARPIQPLGEDDEIQGCAVGDFISDVEKGRPPGNQCRP